MILAGHFLTTLENVTSTYLQKPIGKKASDPANHHTQTQQQLLPQYLTKLQTTFSQPLQGIMHGLVESKMLMESGDGQMEASGHSVIGKLENLIILGEKKTL